MSARVVPVRMEEHVLIQSMGIHVAVLLAILVPNAQIVRDLKMHNKIYIILNIKSLLLQTLMQI